MMNSTWSTAAVIVGIVAAGTVVAGLLNDPQAGEVTIPGCDEVIQPEDTYRINFAITDGNSLGSPWYTEATATAMSDALLGALPEDAVVENDSDWAPFTFQPPAEGDAQNPFVDDPMAYGTVTLDGQQAQLMVRVSRSGEPAGPCFAGTVDERLTLDDGTVVDTSVGRVTAYSTEGNTVDVSADRPFTEEQLIDIATTPVLLVGDSE